MFRKQKSLWVLGLLLLIHGIAAAGQAYFVHSRWNDDATSGLYSSYTYTHAVNISTTGTAPVINGVTLTSGNDYGPDWDYHGGSLFQDADNNITGYSSEIAFEFHATGSGLALTGLNSNQFYELTLLSCEWDYASERIVTMTQGDTTYQFNQNMYGTGNGIKVKVIYRADETGSMYLALSQFHLYAFANRELSEVPVIVYPLTPVNYDGLIRVDPETVELTWAEAIDGSLVEPLFDVYMDPNETKVAASDTSVRVSSQQPSFSFDPDVDPNTLYYWSVVTYLDGEPNQMTEVRNFYTDYADSIWSDSAWTSDANIDVSAGKIYTHKVNFNANEAGVTVINGITFENDSDMQGDNWQLDIAWSTGGRTPNITGDGASLCNGLYFGQSSTSENKQTMMLTGLTPGEEYVLTEYLHGWGSVGTRVVNVTTSAEGRTTSLDQNIYGDLTGVLYKYHYTAPASGELTLTFNAINSGNTWHHYGFSNEVATNIYLDPTPFPGSVLDADSDIELSWVLQGDVVNPTYNIKVGTDPNVLNLVDEQSGLEVSTYDPMIVADNHYYWQVEVVEDGGSIVHTSPVWDFSTVPLPDAIKILEWKLDEEANVVAEETFLGDDGMLIGIDDPNTFGVSHVYGLVTNGLYLNGSNQYVDASDAIDSIPVNDGDFSITGYFRTVADYGPLFSMRSTTSDQPILTIAVGHDGAQTVPGAICVLVRDDAGAMSGMNSGVTLVNDGQWHHFAVTRFGGTWTLYVDGISMDDMTASTSGFAFNLLGFGTDIYWTTTYGWADPIYYKGILDEITVWENVLKVDQIAALSAILPPQGDIDYDLETDIDDLLLLVDQWLMIESECSLPPADLNGDCAVDMLDFAEVAEGWLKNGH